MMTDYAFSDYFGIYICYFTAEYGNSLGMFVFARDGSVVGADVGGGIYNGKLEEKDGYLQGEIGIQIDSGGLTITGARSDLPVSYDTPVKLSVPLDALPFQTIETLTGPVNVRFERKVKL